jgi:hypothetical protein
MKNKKSLNIDTTFRLSTSLKSSYFDLISGNKETKQTKGLGLLLSKSPLALKLFLNIPAIKNKVGSFNLSKISRVIVNCELPSGNYRADIILRFYINQRPLKAIFIEAKSVNKHTSVYKANLQLQEYLTSKLFTELHEFGEECYGITLTKYPSYSQHASLISITWSDLIEVLYKGFSHPQGDNLLRDYFSFITTINGAMKFYEKEVYSIPTEEWSQFAIEQYEIYECPNKGNYLFKYKPLYLTFRGTHGVMEKLYRIEKIIILNFKNDLNTFQLDETYSKTIRKNVHAYAEYMLKEKIWPRLPDDDKQVFILANETIELPKKPRPRKNNTFRAYYELADLLSNEICNIPKQIKVK